MWAGTAKAIGVEDVLTAPRFPWQNAYVERFIGSVRRERSDHVIIFNIFNATGLQRVMHLYCFITGTNDAALTPDAPHD